MNTIPSASTAFIQAPGGSIPQITFPLVGSTVRYVIDRIRTQLYSGTSTTFYAASLHASSAPDGTLWRKNIAYSTQSATEIATPEIDDDVQLIFANGAGPIVTYESAIAAGAFAFLSVDFHLQG